MDGSTENRYAQSKYLPLNYNDSIKTKQLLNTKHMSKTLKQYNVQKWITPITHIIGRWKTQTWGFISHQTNMQASGTNYAFNKQNAIISMKEGTQGLKRL